MKKKLKQVCALLVTAGLLITGCGAASSKEEKKSSVKLDPDNPVQVTVWNYYNGSQQEMFNTLVNEFNQTEGKEKGIEVSTSSYGTVNDLKQAAMDAIDQKAGAQEIPTIFAAYADTAYEFDQKGILANLDDYLTEEDKEEYIDAYIQEGYFTEDGGLKILPVAKATEVFMVNKTDWDKFEQATGITLDACSTIEGLTETAKTYYEWSGGHAMFGRDAMANYMLIGAKQLGTDIIDNKDGKVVISFPEDVARKLWDNYYVPFVNGYFTASGKFRSDDIKTGNSIAFVGSSAGATFFPKEVSTSDTESYPIELEVREAPQFEGSEGYAVQQGAGMAVTNQDDKAAYAAVEFLKWFTEPERNILFSSATGYLPVKKEANDAKKITEVSSEEETVSDIVKVSIDTISENTLYTTPVSDKVNDFRSVLSTILSDKAAEDWAVVEQNLSNGMSHEEAVAQFDTEENFKAWYESAKSALEAAVE